MMTLRWTFILCFFACAQIQAASLRSIYLDDTGNVHIITAEGNDVRLSTEGWGTNVKLSPDGKSAAWIVSGARQDSEKFSDGGSELAVYRNGKVGSIKCGPVIREYWFWMNGDRIAIDCGGRHFAGTEILYDIDTLKALTRFEQATVATNRRPKWSESSDQFSPNE